MLSSFFYFLGKRLMRGSLLFKSHGSHSLSRRVFKLSVEAHEEALDSFEKIPTLLGERRRSIQLQQFIDFARKSVPFYKNIGAHELYNIPPLKKEVIKANSKEFIAEAAVKYFGLPDKTSGSTGIPFSFYLDRRSTAERQAKLFHLWRLIDVDPYETTLLVSSPKFKKITPNNIVYLNPTRIHEDFNEILLEIRQTKPRVVRGNPLAVLEFCWLLRKQEVSDIKFRIAVLYGHTLTPGMRTFIQNTLNCRAYSIYAMGEAGAIGGECRFQHGHHGVEGIIVEIVDEHGNPVPRGVDGNILVTDTTNRVMPLIRYVTGDRGEILEETCPCGKFSPLLKVDGREEEILVCPDGKLVFGGSLRDVLDRYSESIERYQVIQKNSDEFQIKVVPGMNFTENVEADILNDLNKFFGLTSKVSIEYVSNIPLELSGKFKQFISPIWKKKFPADLFNIS